MKKFLLIISILLPSLTAISQQARKSINFELRYPIPTGENFMNSNLLGGNGYIGIIDAGAEYTLFTFSKIGLGIAFNTSIFSLPETDLTVAAFIPKITAEYNLYFQQVTVVPQLGFGYSHWRYRTSPIEYMDDEGNVHITRSKWTDNGMTLEGGVKLIYQTSSRLNWFLQFSYEFTRLGKPNRNEENSRYNRNIHLIYPGFGVVWRFGNND